MVMIGSFQKNQVVIDSTFFGCSYSKIVKVYLFLLFDFFLVVRFVVSTRSLSANS